MFSKVNLCDQEIARQVVSGTLCISYSYWKAWYHVKCLEYVLGAWTHRSFVPQLLCTGWQE